MFGFSRFLLILGVRKRCLGRCGIGLCLSDLAVAAWFSRCCRGRKWSAAEPGWLLRAQSPSSVPEDPGLGETRIPACRLGFATASWWTDRWIHWKPLLYILLWSQSLMIQTLGTRSKQAQCHSSTSWHLRMPCRWLVVLGSHRRCFFGTIPREKCPKSCN